jgi:hypothetical protein
MNFNEELFIVQLLYFVQKLVQHRYRLRANQSQQTTQHHMRGMRGNYHQQANQTPKKRVLLRFSHLDEIFLQIIQEDDFAFHPLAEESTFFGLAPRNALLTQVHLNLAVAR